jgi:hypothetical protein
VRPRSLLAIAAATAVIVSAAILAVAARRSPDGAPVHNPRLCCVSPDGNAMWVFVAVGAFHNMIYLLGVRSARPAQSRRRGSSFCSAPQPPSAGQWSRSTSSRRRSASTVITRHRSEASSCSAPRSSSAAGRLPQPHLHERAASAGRKSGGHPLNPGGPRHQHAGSRAASRERLSAPIRAKEDR